MNTRLFLITASTILSAVFLKPLKRLSHGLFVSITSLTPRIQNYVTRLSRRSTRTLPVRISDERSFTIVYATTEFFACPKKWNFFGRNLNDFPCARVSSHSSVSCTHPEAAKSSEIDPITFCQSINNAAQHSIYDNFTFSLWHINGC